MYKRPKRKYDREGAKHTKKVNAVLREWLKPTKSPKKK